MTLGGIFNWKPRGVHHGRRRNQKPAKLRKIQHEIDEALENTNTTSPRSEQVDEPTSKRISDPSHTTHARNDELNQSELPPVPTRTEQPWESATEVAEAFPQLPVVDAIRHNLAPAGGQDQLPSTVQARDGRPEEAVVDEQTIRKRGYLHFQGEDETDYTRGPPRLVLTNDGIQDCAGLLMTLDLSQKIQTALRSQRHYSRAARRAAAEGNANFVFENKLELHIANHKCHLSALKVKGFAEDCKEVYTVEEELTKLQLLLKNTQARRQGITASLNNDARNLRDLQAEVNEYLDEVFVSAELLEPDVYDDSENSVEELDIEKEYARLCLMLQDSRNDDLLEAAPLHDFGPAFGSGNRDPEEEARAELRKAFWSAQRELQIAQAVFDRREDDREQEWQANTAAASRGEHTTDPTPDDFDLRWLVQEQQLTRKLIEAEAEFVRARDAAIKGDADLPGMADEQTSGFLDDVDDGYTPSFEQEMVDSVPPPKVHDWLNRVPSTIVSPSYTNRSGAERVDEWETDELGVGDSYSAIVDGTAEGPRRVTIDKWRRICGL